MGTGGGLLQEVDAKWECDCWQMDWGEGFAVNLLDEGRGFHVEGGTVYETYWALTAVSLYGHMLHPDSINVA